MTNQNLLKYLPQVSTGVSNCAKMICFSGKIGKILLSYKRKEKNICLVLYNIRKTNSYPQLN